MGYGSGHDSVSISDREIMQQLLCGEQPEITPQWLMGFANEKHAKKLVPEEFHYYGYSEYPAEGSYPLHAMGPELLAKQVGFNDYIDRVAFPIGWGANAAFGHGGPGEFRTRIISKDQDRFCVEYETGAKKEIRFCPHNQHTYYLPVSNSADMEKLRLPDPCDRGRYEGIRSDIAWAKAHGQWTIASVNGFFSGLHYFFMDYQNLLMALLLEPEMCRRMFEMLGSWNIKAAACMCEAGIDCIAFCDDLGSNESMLISPQVYREMILPWHKELCDTVHSYGAVVHMHSHGAITPVLGDIAAAGVDILNPVDPDDRMAIEEVRSLVGEKMVLCGGMDKHFFDWSREIQFEFLKSTIVKGRKNGPYILMDSGGIPQNVDREHFKWFLEVSSQLRSSY